MWIHNDMRKLQEGKTQEYTNILGDQKRVPRSSGRLRSMWLLVYTEIASGQVTSARNQLFILLTVHEDRQRCKDNIQIQ